MARVEPLAGTYSFQARAKSTAHKYSIRISRTTPDYDPRFAKLHWSQRLIFRNALSTVSAFIPSMPSVMIFSGVYYAIEAFSLDVGVRLTVLVIACTVFFEIAITLMKNEVDEGYLQRRPIHCLVEVLIWTIVLLVKGGQMNLVEIITTFHVQFFFAILLNGIALDHHSLEQLRVVVFNAIFYPVLFFAVVMATAGYSFFINYLKDPITVLIVTGCVYPLLTHCLKELVFEFVVTQSDEDLGLDTANGDIERGTYIATVAAVEAIFDLPNKVAIGEVASTGNFALAMAISLAIEVAAKLVAMIYHRNKHVAMNTVKTATKEGASVIITALSDRTAPSPKFKVETRIETGEEKDAEIREKTEDRRDSDTDQAKMESTTVLPLVNSGIQWTNAFNQINNENKEMESEQLSGRLSSFKKAAHRHRSERERKKYEFRVYYEELGEATATIAAFGMLVAIGQQSPLDGAFRLMVALAMELLADIIVWSIMEVEGYTLSAIITRPSFLRLTTIALMVVNAQGLVIAGNMSGEFFVANVTEYRRSQVQEQRNTRAELGAEPGASEIDPRVFPLRPTANSLLQALLQASASFPQPGQIFRIDWVESVPHSNQLTTRTVMVKRLLTMVAFVGAVAGVTGSTASATLSVSAKWHFAGPSTYKTRVGKDEPEPLAAAGAVQNVAKGSGLNWFIGSVNGGLWKSSDIGAAKFVVATPSWVNVLDGQPVSCSSIAALHVSHLDSRRVYAGCGGSTSSEQGSDWNVLNSGEWSGVMSSIDGGDTWKMLGGFPVNYYVTDIYEVDENRLLVSAQSNLFDREDGGIWLSTDQGKTFNRVSSKPTFNLLQWQAAGGSLVATHTRDAQYSASVSHDFGKTWNNIGALDWTKGSTPFYTCATELKNGDLVLAGLTRSPGLPNNTNSQFFVKSPSENSFRTLSQPTSMDQDAMPKDRMAVLGDPSVDDLLYVAGNAGALAYRVNTTTGHWTKMWDEDVTDGSLPHGDCRNFAWDPENGGRVVLTSDGGVFAREQPRKAGGKWKSLNGDYASMELLSAHYNNREGTFVAGAQDNCAQLVKSNATEVATGFVEGDGTVTLVDNVANPARMFGTTQFMGVGSVDIDPQRRRRLEKVDDDDADDYAVEDDDDSCGGLCFVQGNKFINVPLTDYFPEPSNFPFFVQPYVLNSQDPSRLVFWTNGTAGRRSAFYEFEIPYTVKTSKDIPAPREILVSPPGAFFLDFVSGGFTSGKADPELLIGISSSHLFVKNNSTGAGSEMVARDLPMIFAAPVNMIYDEKTPGKPRILGPVTHGRTVSLAVSPADSNVVAVTGWPSVKTNRGPERIFVSFDAGLAWLDVTGDLREASGIVGKVRPGGLLIVDLVKNNDRALLTGTSNGVYVTFLDSFPGLWVRLGSVREFPIVLVADLSFEHYSNKIIAATFGRGIYVFDNAKEALLDVRDQIWNLHGHKEDRFVPRVAEESSTRFFPEQL